MPLYEKIQFIRTLKGWSQEDMAEKLAMSVNGYAKIERGETDIPLSRLEQIAQVLGIELQELFNPHGRVLINLGGINGDYAYIHECSITNTQKDLEQEIEKIRLLNSQKDREISLLQEQVVQLKEIIALMRKTTNGA